MKPENKQFLDEHFHHFMVLERAFYLRGLQGSIREGMQRVMSEEFQPGYTADLWCGTCCADMVNALYRQYYNWLKRIHNDETVYKDLTEGIEALKDKPLIVHANFPANGQFIDY